MLPARFVVLTILFLMLGCIRVSDAVSQVQMFSSPPDIDSFPVVRTNISITDNGKPAQVNKSHFSVLEDGAPITNFDLLNCDESESASIAVVVDVSGSMAFTLSKGSDEFYQGFSLFAGQLSPTSEFALVPFNDTVARIIPASYRTQDFYQVGNSSDRDEFLDSVGGLQFSEGTDVDLALRVAALHLRKGVHDRKAIVLVTDDAVYEWQALSDLLRQEGITLFVLELDGDTILNNLLAAQETDGKFYSPKDSTEIGPMMVDIAHAIYAKKCTLRYVSTHLCPWYSNKTLWIGLNYQLRSLTQVHRFAIGANVTDSTAPVLSELIVDDLSRLVRAEEQFPCQRGLRSLTDSALTNFAKLTRVRSLPLLAYDSIVVVDGSQSASGFYIATDSNGNSSRIRISYSPPPDTLAPLWSVPTRTSVEQYEIVASELRKWDKGIESIVLDPLSTNVQIDSTVYLSHRLAKVYISRIDAQSVAYACLNAIDSVGNEGRQCQAFEVSDRDTLAPVIAQRALQSPYSSISADVTEVRAGDRGIASITTDQLINLAPASTIYSTPFVGSAQLSILDSFYSAFARITAIDSVGNVSIAMLRYDPIPDTIAPRATVMSIDLTTTDVAITEVEAWDRGLMRVVLLRSSNVTELITADSRRLATRTFLSIDPYVDGTAEIEAVDSSNNLTVIQVLIPAQTRPGLLPLTYSDPIGFGTVSAPSYLKRSVSITNPNAEAITLTAGSWSGDDSVFASTAIFPITIASNSSHDLEFEFTPKLLNNWSATYTLSSDKTGSYEIRMSGASTGSVHFSASHKLVEFGGSLGELQILMSGSPSISNLDSISFEISVNDDVAVLDRPNPDCSKSPWLCNYEIEWIPVAAGVYSIELVRKSNLQSLDFGTAPAITIPFQTFLSASDRSDVIISNAKASRSIVVASNGSISIGSACADSLVRQSLSEQRIGKIVSISLDATAVTCVVDLKLDALIDVAIFDISGVQRSESTISVIEGQSVHKLPSNELSSGRYQIVIRSGEQILDSRSFEVVR